MEAGSGDRRRRRRGAARTAACALAALTFLAGPAMAGEPGSAGESRTPPLCCGVPPADEVTADQVFGHWFVMHAGIGAPVRAGESVQFRRDGTVDTDRGPCRFAVLRAELTVTCAERSQSGEVRFEGDRKLIWRLDGRETMFLAPAN